MLGKILGPARLSFSLDCLAGVFIPLTFVHAQVLILSCSMVFEFLRTVLRHDDLASMLANMLPEAAHESKTGGTASLLIHGSLGF